MQIVAGIENSSKTLMRRQKPTRLPYSCQAQFGTSGVGEPPAGGLRTVRGIGCVGSHSSTATMTQTAIRPPSGSLSGGRSVIGEYPVRSVGSLGCLGGLFRRDAFPARSIILELSESVWKPQVCDGREFYAQRRSYAFRLICDCRTKAKDSQYSPSRRLHRKCRGWED